MQLLSSLLPELSKTQALIFKKGGAYMMKLNSSSLLDFLVSLFASIPPLGWFLIVLAAIIMYLLFLLLYTPSSEYVGTRLKEMDAFSGGSERDKEMQRTFTDRLISSTKEYVKIQFDKNDQHSKLAPLQAKLIQAGSETDPLTHWTYKLLYALGIGSFTFILNFSPIAGTLPMFPIFLASTAFGFFIPDLQLSTAIKKRKMRLKASLPDFLDLLASTQPASNNFEDALARVCAKLHNEITKEFQQALDEINAGARTRKALTDLAFRCNLEEMNRFISAINHAQAFGVGLEKTLKQQALNMRKIKKQMAEIKARQSAILLILPTVFLLVTCMIMIAGPSLLAMIDPNAAQL